MTHGGWKVPSIIPKQAISAVACFSARARMDIGRLCPRMSTADQRLGCSRHPVGMFQDRPAYDEPEKPGGEGWIANRDLEQLCQFRPTSMTTYAKWVEVRTFHWKPPYPPVPKTSRRMLRQNAIHAWRTMLKTDWVRCRPPVDEAGNLA